MGPQQKSRMERRCVDICILKSNESNGARIRFVCIWSTEILYICHFHGISLCRETNKHALVCMRVSSVPLLSLFPSLALSLSLAVSVFALSGLSPGNGAGRRSDRNGE